ncbi:PIN domain-containing protein [Natronosporangium hydrolyticum]|uniref:PIN domain-containing protein n=1 Tax=Natronosporangium hydrolyticum TaxID=2811111 RepID=A0A895YBK8_9ACTN|nr:PIN domain-containing protein [Natronosporangium hydrolyticum]QSB13612.1 PIN domain-containing protein [Natronosporangium hydrolyticum]
MAAVILLDTHVLVWLYADPDRLLPAAVRRRLNAEPLGLSPFVRLELHYLHEVGKLTVPAAQVLEELTAKLEMSVTDPPAALVCEAATELTWTRDPFDRLLAAQAIATATPLITKDRTIRAQLSLAWWDEDRA